MDALDSLATANNWARVRTQLEIDRVEIDQLESNQLESNQVEPISRRQGKLWARRSLQKLAADCCGLQASQITIDFTTGRRPRIRGAKKRLYGSLSHTAAGFAVAVSDHPVGVDLEQIRDLRNPESLAHKLSQVHADDPEDVSFGSNTPNEVDTNEVIKKWTRYEAVAKLLGIGLKLSLSDLEILADGTVIRAGNIWPITVSSGLIGGIASADTKPQYMLSVATRKGVEVQTVQNLDSLQEIFKSKEIR